MIVYEDDLVTLHPGDARDLTQWTDADVLVTDPPYGRAWRRASLSDISQKPDRIVGDEDTSSRDAILAAWGTKRPAAVFGDLMLAPPAGTKHVLIYQKPPGSGVWGAIGGFRRDAEAIYLLGPWPSRMGGRTSILTTATTNVGSPYGPAGRTGHPHTKPGDLMAVLIDMCPPGAIADPFAGSGSTLIAARNAGRRCVGVEIDPDYCATAARRLAQHAFAFDT